MAVSRDSAFFSLLASITNAYKKKSRKTAQTTTSKFNDESGAIEIQHHFLNIYKIKSAEFGKNNLCQSS